MLHRHPVGGATPDSKLASDAPDVLPLLSRDDLEDTLRRLPPQAMRRILRHGVVPVAWRPDHVLYATCGPRGADFARRHGLPVVARIASPDFHHGVRRVWGRKILARATHGLLATRPQFSARKRVTLAQTGRFLILAACLALGFALCAGQRTLGCGQRRRLACFFSRLLPCACVACFRFHHRKTARPCEYLSDAELPTYSVLVPVFRETSVLTQLLRGLSCLNYPVEKLEIKIIVEEFDTQPPPGAREICSAAAHRGHCGAARPPQTKPRALNYALQFCRGSLLTIYDAEDVPEPNQLREVAREFLNADERLACLQAQLTAYNPNENWLTRQFTAEYATLFGLILPALAARNLPLTLGGTSNHFRTHSLAENRRLGFPQCDRGCGFGPAPGAARLSHRRGAKPHLRGGQYPTWQLAGPAGALAQGFHADLAGAYAQSRKDGQGARSQPDSGACRP